jgi:hypothetical protein
VSGSGSLESVDGIVSLYVGAVVRVSFSVTHPLNEQVPLALLLQVPSLAE